MVTSDMWWWSFFHIVYRYWDYPQGLCRASICRYSANRRQFTTKIQTYFTMTASKNREKWIRYGHCYGISPSFWNRIPFPGRILAWLAAIYQWMISRADFYGIWVPFWIDCVFCLHETSVNAPCRHIFFRQCSCFPSTVIAWAFSQTDQ